MYDLTLDGVIACLQDKGNKCTQPELQAAFKPHLRDSESRKAFTQYVNKCAFVKTKEDKKIVFLKKRTST